METTFGEKKHSSSSSSSSSSSNGRCCFDVVHSDSDGILDRKQSSSSSHRQRCDYSSHSYQYMNDNDDKNNNNKSSTIIMENNHDNESNSKTKGNKITHTRKATKINKKSKSLASNRGRISIDDDYDDNVAVARWTKCDQQPQSQGTVKSTRSTKSLSSFNRKKNKRGNGRNVSKALLRGRGGEQEQDTAKPRTRSEMVDAFIDIYFANDEEKQQQQQQHQQESIHENDISAIISSNDLQQGEEKNSIHDNNYRKRSISPSVAYDSTSSDYNKVGDTATAEEDGVQSQSFAITLQDSESKPHSKKMKRPDRMKEITVRTYSVQAAESSQMHAEQTIKREKEQQENESLNFVEPAGLLKWRALLGRRPVNDESRNDIMKWLNDVLEVSGSICNSIDGIDASQISSSQPDTSSLSAQSRAE